MASFAYLFERFPASTQTFCYREVTEMCRKGADPAIFSIRRPAEIPIDCPAEIAEAVCYLPDEATLRDEIKTPLKEQSLSKELRTSLKQPDFMRLCEALWLGPRLRDAGIGHVHAHFAGIAARTAHWLKRLYGITYSFTGHANDIFCDVDFPITHVDLIREASLVITETDFSCQWLKEQYPKWANKFHRVYNGIDPSELFTAPLASGKPHIVSVGRNVEKKGFSDLIDACALLRDRGIEFVCSIVGDGPLAPSLRAQVEKLQLTDRVRLTGRKPQEEVRAILAQSHLFVLACVTEASGGMDNFPTVIIEAMGTGLPVISTRLAGVPEMLEDQANGLMVNERDPAALANAMEAILADPEKGRAMGAEGKKRVAERFASPVTADSLIQLLAGLPQVKMPFKPSNHPPLGLRLRNLWRAVTGFRKPA